MMKIILLLGIVVVCVLPSLCRPTDCNKAVLDVIAQIRLRLDELESAHWDTLGSHQTKTHYKNAASSVPLKLHKPRKNRNKKKHGLHCGKINHERAEKVFITTETSSTSESTTIDYTTETLEMIVSNNAGNLTTELSGGFTDNPTTLSN